MMNPKKLLTEKTADYIIEYIQKNALKVGDKLPNEYDLAKTLNVSRSTLREAVKELRIQNILEVKHGSGTYILNDTKSPATVIFAQEENSLDLVKDFFEIRYLVEPTITAKAALRATKADIKKLSNWTDKMKKSYDLGTMDHIEYDTRFHLLIADLAGNMGYVSLVPVIFDSIYLYNRDFSDQAIKNTSIDYHREIIKAFEKKDAMRAHDNAMLHIIHTRNSLPKK
ncbi:FadR family transcriptional regulator [Dolosicoccus paucivorans]|uniref:FadR family transcriptional regulator n=1 Tax=Dolosicoccus paucivorans TaxID=84521 RepID=A0A2N6SLG1_9LACT|nr:FadR/GntR family transcriptional regulator [Dolosicoccus paucivorans]PMC57902.1 FadR family transcriptional regulator [Dolosicoccus paucivorans]